MVQLQRNLNLWALLILMFTFSIVICGRVPIKKRSLVGLGSGEMNEQRSTKFSKRTFCNAFTGCGRKRSDGSIPNIDYEYDNRGDSSVENVEDPLDDLARDILAEARLWEAFQARNSIKSPMFPKHGILGRQKRTVYGGSSNNSEQDVSGESP